LERRTGHRGLEPLDDRLEWEAHDMAVEKALRVKPRAKRKGAVNGHGSLVGSARRLIARTASRV
jgi:hypothetical protein